MTNFRWVGRLRYYLRIAPGQMEYTIRMLTLYCAEPLRLSVISEG